MGDTINKRLKAKVVHKHETAAGWERSNYIPDVGEIVFYDPDETHNYTRQKNGDGVNTVKNLPFTTPQSDWNEIDTSAVDYIKNKPGLSAGPGKHHLVAAENYTAGTVTYTSEIIEGSRLENDGWGYSILSFSGELYPYYYAKIDIYNSEGILYKDVYLDTVDDTVCDERGNGITFMDKMGNNLDLSNEQFYFTITDGSTPPDWLTEEISFSINQTDCGDYGLVIGENIKNGGNHNLLVGQGLIHKGNNALIIGQYNEQDPNALLQVGSGNSGYRKNALSVTDIKTVAPRMQVTNLTPSSSYELTTKHYVDNRVDTHANNTNVHVTAEEKQKWNNMASGGGGSSNKLERTWLPAGYSDECYAESVYYDISAQPDNTRTYYYCNGMDEYGNWSTGDMYLTINPQANIFVNIEDNYNVSRAWDDTLIISAIDPYYTLEIEVVTYEHWDVSQCTIFIYTTNANPGAATKLE